MKLLRNYHTCADRYVFAFLVGSNWTFGIALGDRRDYYDLRIYFGLSHFVKCFQKKVQP